MEDDKIRRQEMRSSVGVGGVGKAGRLSGYGRGGVRARGAGVRLDIGLDRRAVSAASEVASTHRPTTKRRGAQVASSQTLHYGL